MTAPELADALESLAEEPTLCTALSAADVTELRLAARLLRAQHALLLDTGRSLTLLTEAIERVGGAHEG